MVPSVLQRACQGIPPLPDIDPPDTKTEGRKVKAELVPQVRKMKVAIDRTITGDRVGEERRPGMWGVTTCGL